MKKMAKVFGAAVLAGALVFSFASCATTQEAAPAEETVVVEEAVPAEEVAPAEEAVVVEEAAPAEVAPKAAL